MVESEGILKSELIGDLYFGQQHHLHQPFFRKYNGQHSRVKLRDMPHYLTLRDGKLMAKSGNLYEKYLKQSWKYYLPTKNTNKRRLEKRVLFKGILEDAAKNGIKKQIHITDAYGGGRVIIDGNHRASIAYHLGIDVPYRYSTPNQAINRQVELAVKGQHHEDVYYYDKKILSGGGDVRDTYERFADIRVSDIRGKSVLHLGAGIGATASLAWSYGAREVVAMEGNPRVASASLRVGAIVNSFHSVAVHDVLIPIKGRSMYNTVLCFIPTLRRGDISRVDIGILQMNITKTCRDVLYIELPRGQYIDEYSIISRHFRVIERVSVDDRTGSQLFRCKR